MTDTARIEALWIEPGTAADAAAAANLYRAADQKLSAVHVREIWDRAKAEGRLPPFDRPFAGFRPNQAEILRTFVKASVGKAA